VVPQRAADRRPDDSGIRTCSWWDNPGAPTPYLLWGLVWCRCGIPMVPLDRPAVAAPPLRSDRFYRCDAGCGRAPVPAGGLEVEVFTAVVAAALDRFPRYTLQGVRARRAARLRGTPDSRRELIRRWIERVVAGGNQPPQLQWVSGPV
jgi:hypothetical protein